MDKEQLDSLFKPCYITDSNDTTKEGGHGFGLLNCKGIVEKYKKMSSFFSVCSIGAESEEGSGSRVFFRLPKGMKKVLMFCALLLSVFCSCAKTNSMGVVINEMIEHDRQIRWSIVYIIIMCQATIIARWSCQIAAYECLTTCLQTVCL